MIKKHWGVIAVIGGAVFALWLYLRKGTASVTTSFQPSTSSSGLPNYSPQTQTVANALPNTVSPSPTVSTQSSSTLNPQPALDNVRASQPALFGNDSQGQHYLNYNVPPSRNLSTVKPSQAMSTAGAPASSCGCGDSACKPSCHDNNAHFTDGQGQGCMAIDRKKLIDNLEKNYPGVWDKFTEQVMNSGFDSSDVAVLSHAAGRSLNGSGLPFDNIHVAPAAPGQWIHPMIYKLPKYQS